MLILRDCIIIVFYRRIIRCFVNMQGSYEATGNNNTLQWIQ